MADLHNNERGTTEETPVVLDNMDAKQGIELHRMRYVLGISLGGAVLCLAIAGLVYFG